MVAGALACIQYIIVCMQASGKPKPPWQTPKLYYHNRMIQYLTTSFFTIESFITMYVWFCIGYTTTFIGYWMVYSIYKLYKNNKRIKSKNKMRPKNCFRTLKIWDQRWLCQLPTDNQQQSAYFYRDSSSAYMAKPLEKELIWCRSFSNGIFALLLFSFLYYSNNKKYKKFRLIKN